MGVEPFDIYDLGGVTAGRVGICRQPGQSGDMDHDMAVIAAWNPSVVVTLTSEQEFPAASDLPIAFAKADYHWLHLPIVDYGIPAAADRALFEQSVVDLSEILHADGRVLIHCKGGQGRSGMLALRLLINQAEPPNLALSRLRAVRPHAVETDQQFAWAAQKA